jgi:chemotaxis protein methyltransferase CheR
MTMDTGLLQRFTQLIASHTGLQIRPEETDKLRQTLQLRMTQERLIIPETYYQLLTTDTAASRHEWEELVLPLTIGETYFFRDGGQLSLLRHRILPELIERNQASRSLRIWSAGCSTGEEAYSLAILVHELLPSRADWNIVIVGTDVNKHAIDVARRGMYRQHSLRTLDHALRDRYFHQHQGDWELHERFRSMVSFHRVNLLKDPFPDPRANLSDMDLILCRNVFIYFARTAVTQVISKFTKTLHVGGYLITGHAELHDQKSSELAVKAFPESIVYRRENARNGASKPGPSERLAAPVPSKAQTSVLQREGIPGKPVTVSQPRTSASSPANVCRTVMPQPVPHSSQAQSASADDLCSQARVYADAGQYESAIRSCQLALSKDALAEKPYYLLAQIAEVQGDIAAAKNFLKKILYVAPASVTAHLELAALYAKGHDLPRACKLLNLALELLKALPPDAVIEPFVNLPVAQLLPEVQRRMEQLGYSAPGLS